MIAIAMNTNPTARTIGGHTTQNADSSASRISHVIATSATCVSASTARREGFNAISVRRNCRIFSDRRIIYLPRYVFTG